MCQQKNEMPGAMETQRKMDKIVAMHQKDLSEARQVVSSWLTSNGFPADANGKKGVFFVTFALHEAVKQRNLYIVAKLLLFGANPTIQDTWCCTAYDYAKRGKDSEAQEIVKIIDRSGRGPRSPQLLAHSNLERTPPPRGFEEFFAHLAATDPLVQVPNCEAQWLNELGPRPLRGAVDSVRGKVGKIF
ncbi:unnamed protein product [Cladocopium goreaui]|uniref:Mitotic checkpoint protein BUB3.2 n=1 Tax=Cladocopium goreaui TaxID=2562237 RepID=A0A9P1CPE7_9DINO|nr:unnamed protein product [Cladocopium goreaui]